MASTKGVRGLFVPHIVYGAKPPSSPCNVAHLVLNCVHLDIKPRWLTGHAGPSLSVAEASRGESGAGAVCSGKAPLFAKSLTSGFNLHPNALVGVIWILPGRTVTALPIPG